LNTPKPHFWGMAQKAVESIKLLVRALSTVISRKRYGWRKPSLA